MDKVLGIIAEYNPFHNGHLYHLNKSKELAKADYSVAVISGNFTQRGEPALIDKWSRAKMAVLNGVDLVLELPVLYATSSAENFADGAIRLLDSLGIVDDIYFGAENANIHVLEDFAEVLYKEPKEYKALLSAELEKGLSYPKARENALMIYLNYSRQYANVLSSPNNILGIEYLKDKIPASLERAKGYLRSELARRVKARKMPELIFKYDEALEYGNHINEIINKINKND